MAAWASAGPGITFRCLVTNYCVVACEVLKGHVKVRVRHTRDCANALSGKMAEY